MCICFRNNVTATYLSLMYMFVYLKVKQASSLPSEYLSQGLVYKVCQNHTICSNLDENGGYRVT